jgi:hypothetical protein
MQKYSDHVISLDEANRQRNLALGESAPVTQFKFYDEYAEVPKEAPKVAYQVASKPQAAQGPKLPTPKSLERKNFDPSDPYVLFMHFFIILVC